MVMKISDNNGNSNINNHINTTAFGRYSTKTWIIVNNLTDI